MKAIFILILTDFDSKTFTNMSSKTIFQTKLVTIRLKWSKYRMSAGTVADIAYLRISSACETK